MSLPRPSRPAVLVGGFLGSLIVLALLAERPSRADRADAAARHACKVFREPFDGTNPKQDALPTEQRVAARHASLVKTEAEVARAARLDPRWNTLYEAWHDFVTNEDAVTATQTVLSECRIALAG